MTRTSKLTREAMIEDIIEILEADPAEFAGVAEGTADVDLLDVGLDSVRMMTLIERWRARGSGADFVEFAEDPSLQEWFRVAGAEA